MADALLCSHGLSLLQDEYTDLTKASPQLRVRTDFQEAYEIFSSFFVLQKQDLMSAYQTRLP